MSGFLSDLKVHIKDDEKTWVLDEPLIFSSDLMDRIITVPAGFETDFASVPRVPFVYTLMGNVAHKAAVVHDFLYVSAIGDKATADKVFMEAMKATGVWAWRRYPMYWAVYLFGRGSY